MKIKTRKTFAGLKIVWKYLAVYKKDLTLLSVFGIISALANAATPYLAGRLFDSILSYETISLGWIPQLPEVPLWLFILSLWFLVRAAGDIVDWRSSVKSDWLGEDITTSYIANGFNKLLELPLSFHKTFKIGEVTEKINRASSSLEMMTKNILISLAPQFLSILIAFTVTFSINFKLSFVMLFGLFLYVIVLVSVVRPLADLHRKGHKAYGKAYGDSYDAIFNVQAVKQAVTEKHEQKRITRNFKIKAMTFWLRIFGIWQKLSFYQQVIILATQVGIFLLSISFIQKEIMTIGQLVMFNAYAAMLFGPFVILGRNWQMMQNGIAALERSEKILSAEPEVYEPENAVILSDIAGEVELENITFEYKTGHPVLKNISLKIKAGEVIALVGESGVGKSTLIDLISGYFFPKQGKVLIDGHNIKNLSLRFLRSKIAIVPQETVLFNDSVKTNVKYGSFGKTDEEVLEAARKAHCLDFIEKFPKKWEQKVGERGVKLSVGQKQRISIARAILREPKILILDEPTSALDARSEKVIQESLEQLMKGRTTFIIAHRLSTVRNADRILVLDKGKIIETGRHEELLEKKEGSYRKLYEMQVGLRS